MGGLGFYSVWLLLLSLLGLYALAATPAFASADTPPGSAGNTTANRLPGLDGLRGFLALAVVFHHAAIYHRFLLDGVWSAPPSAVFVLLGPFGVRLFFMITGFLFWSQLLRARGRPAWAKLYVGRLFRIGPLFLLAACTVLVTVASLTGLHLRESLPRLLVHLGRWLSLGILPVSAVNGYAQTGLLLADVTWTLRWEWIFYFSLPLLALFARGRRQHLAFVVSALLLCQAFLLYAPAPERAPVELYNLFLLGMISASLYREGWLLRLPDWMQSLLFVTLLLLSFCLPNVPLLPPVELAAMLYLLVSGCTVFGVLTSRPARRLGDISYGIYLLQGLALAAVFRLPALRNVELNIPAVHWLMSFASATLLLVFAAAAHVLVELPGIAVGKRAAAALAQRLQKAASSSIA